MQTKESKLEILGPVWVKDSHPALASSLKEALGANAQVYNGKDPPAGESPSSVVLCPDKEDIAATVRCLLTLCPAAPILVFSQRADSDLARRALRAGACGVVHAGMRPAQIARALSLAREGEIVVPREILGELVGHRLFLRLPKLLDP